MSRTPGSSGAAVSRGRNGAASQSPQTVTAPLADVSSSGPKHAAIRLAVTLDDLPGGGAEVGDYTHAKILGDIIATLHAHHVKHAVGFVVGSMLEGHPERREAMDAWVQAGFEVGNHTYSHNSIGEHGIDAYIHDIQANREVVDALEQRTGQRRKYFRYPYLEEGRTEAERTKLGQALAAQHYTLARVSIRFGDTDWADPYLRCLRTGDNAALRALDQNYLDHALAQLEWSVDAAHEVLGHPIPQVLLLHPNAPTSRNLDALLTAYERAGVRYISLEEALSEPAYTANYETNGDNLFEQASRHAGQPSPPELVSPAPLLDLVCRRVCSYSSPNKQGSLRLLDAPTQMHDRSIGERRYGRTDGVGEYVDGI